MNTLLGWLVTYLIHSTILLGLAWCVDRLLRGRPHWQELAWKVALVGGLLTATAQTTSALRPWGGTWTLVGEPARLSTTEITSLAPSPVALVSTMALADRAEPAQPAVAATPARWNVRPAVLGVWAACALLLLGRLGRSWLSLRRQLRDRRPLGSEPIQTALAALASRAPRVREPRLSVGPRVAVPMAIGLLRPEICLSERVVRELSSEAQEGLLAHELGHLVRRDPLFRLLSSVIGSAFFFQPLNWLAARKLSACAELLSDDWAARRTARPLALAECLTTVARWTVSPVRGLTIAAAVTGPSDLKLRIKRLLRGEALTSETPRPLWAGPIASCALLALTLLAPSACGGLDASGRPPAAPGGAPQESAHAPRLSPPDATETCVSTEDEADDEASGRRAPSDERGEAAKGEQARKKQDPAGRARTAIARGKVHDHEEHEEEDAEDDDDSPLNDGARGAAPEADDDDDNDNDDNNDDEHGPTAVHAPPLHPDLNIDDNDPRADEHLEKLRNEMEIKTEVEKELQRARKELHRQLAEVKEMESSLRKDMEQAQKDRIEAQKKLRELEVQLPELQRKARKAREQARRAAEQARPKNRP
jgi:Zn-dependent protease with chaperone function